MFDLTKVNWNRLYYFYVVGQTQSITVAARQVNLDQSAMSRQIIALEKELGLELLFRGRVGISLTEVGESVYKMACKIIELSLEENQNIDNIRNEVSGTLRVLTTQTVMRNCTDYLPQFYKKFPKICVQFDVSRRMNDIKQLKNYDVAILPKFSDNPDLEYVPCRTEKLAIYVSKEYLEIYPTPRKPEDLDHHKLISYSSSSSSIGFVDFHLTLGRKDKNPRTPILHLGTPDSLVAACEKGMGIIVYSDEKGIPIPKNFVKILEKNHSKSISFHFMFKKKQEESRKIKEFISFFREYLG